MKSIFLLILVQALIFTENARACTAVSLPNAPDAISGYNCDWHQKHGYLLSNPRSYKKTSLVFGPQEKTLQWKAKYGSITFNQHGREFPSSGINEKGLSANVLWLDSTVHPSTDLPKLNELQWVQYILDTAQTVDEATERVQEFSVSPLLAKFHYFVCDAQKECAAFEYLSGRLVIHRQKTMPVATLANDEYSTSLKVLFETEGFGGTKPVPLDNSSLS